MSIDLRREGFCDRGSRVSIRFDRKVELTLFPLSLIFVLSSLFVGAVAGCRYGSQCRCGDSFENGMGGILDGSVCSMPCVGESFSFRFSFVVVA